MHNKESNYDELFYDGNYFTVFAIAYHKTRH